MKNFADKFKCNNCNEEFYIEVSKNDIYDIYDKPYIPCPYCLERIYLKEKEYKIKITFDNNNFVKIRGLSKFSVIYDYLKKMKYNCNSISKEMERLRDCFIVKE